MYKTPIYDEDKLNKVFMKVFKTIAEFREWRKNLDRNAIAEDGALPSVGFVPTMGALHLGHRSLLERAAAENEIVVLSIFVNPTQFNRTDDFANYPKTAEMDLAMASEVGVDAILLPKNPTELYPDEYRYRISEAEFSKKLEGAHRPGHFEGMLTVVMKLLQLTRPTRAYFGEKDFQQLELVRGMADAFFLDTKIVGCPTVREDDGLAMSSRNLRLGDADRRKAPGLYQAMTKIRDAEEARRSLEAEGFSVDYLEDVALSDGSIRRLAAASLVTIRLIDNLPLASVSRGGVE